MSLSRITLPGLPRAPRRLFGRVGERHRALRHLQFHARHLVITGPPGIGKTSFMVHVAHHLSHRPLLAPGGVSLPVVVLDLRCAGRDPDPLFYVWRQLAASRGGPEWEAELRRWSQPGPTGEGLASLLRSLAQGSGLILCLDGVEGILRGGHFRDLELEQWWTSLREQTSEGGPLYVVSTCFGLPPDTPPDEVLELAPLTWPATLALWTHLQGRHHSQPEQLLPWFEVGVNTPQRLRLLSQWWRTFERGQVQPPRPVDLHPSQVVPRPQVDEVALAAAVWGQLTAHQRSLLHQAAVLLEPAPLALLAELDQAGVLGGLVDGGLLEVIHPRFERGGGDRVILNPALGSSAWPGQEASPLLARVGAWYHRRLKVENRLEHVAQALSHSISAGEPGRSELVALAPVLQKMAIWLRDRGRFAEARNWLTRWQSAAPPGETQLVSQLLVVQLDRLAGKVPRLAVDLFSRGDAPPGFPSPTLWLQEWAHYLAWAGQLSLAQQVQGRLVGLLSSAGPTSGMDLAAARREWAEIYRRRGQYREALSEVDGALGVAQGLAGGEQHPEVIQILVSRGRILREIGKLEEARTLLQRCLALQKRVFGPQAHLSVGIALRELALIQLDLGDRPGARRRLLQSQQVLRQLFGGDDHAELALTLFCLGRLLTSEGEIPEARTRLEECLSLQLRCYGSERHPDVATTLTALGGLQLHLGELTGARHRLERSLSLQLSLLGNESPGLAITQHELAKVDILQGDLTRGIERLEDALRHARRTRGADHLEVATLEMTLGATLMGANQPERGKSLLEHAYRTFLQQAGTEHPITQQLMPMVGRPSDAKDSPVWRSLMRGLAAMEGIPVPVERLLRIAYRITLRSQAGELVPILLLADVSPPEPGLLVTDPARLGPPPGCPEEVTLIWPALTAELAHLRARFFVEARRLAALLPMEGGYPDVRRLTLPPPGTDDVGALVDEARAVVVGAESRGDLTEVERELPVWVRAAEATLRHNPVDDGAEMGRRLMRMVPYRASEIYQVLKPSCTVRHRQILEPLTVMAMA